MLWLPAFPMRKALEGGEGGALDGWGGGSLMQKEGRTPTVLYSRGGS